MKLFGAFGDIFIEHTKGERYDKKSYADSVYTDSFRR